MQNAKDSDSGENWGGGGGGLHATLRYVPGRCLAVAKDSDLSSLDGRQVAQANSLTRGGWAVRNDSCQSGLENQVGGSKDIVGTVLSAVVGNNGKSAQGSLIGLGCSQP